MHPITKRRHLLFWASIFIIFYGIVGCAAKKPFWGDHETGLNLVYRMSPDQVWTFHSTSDQNTFMEMMGRSMETKTDIYKKYSVQKTGMDDQNNLLTQVTIDTMNMVSKGPRGERDFDLAKLIGKTFQLTFSENGEELEFSGVDTLQVDLGQMAGGTRKAKSFFRDIFPDLPKKPIKPKDKWTSTKEITQPQGGMEIKINIDATHTFNGFETINGVECVKINTKLTGTLGGQGEQGGNQMAFEGDMEGSSTWYFAYKKGVFVKVESDNFMEATIAISGQTNMTMPMTQETKSTVELTSSL